MMSRLSIISKILPPARSAGVVIPDRVRTRADFDARGTRNILNKNGIFKYFQVWNFLIGSLFDDKSGLTITPDFCHLSCELANLSDSPKELSEVFAESGVHVLW